MQHSTRPQTLGGKYFVVRKCSSCLDNPHIVNKHGFPTLFMPKETWVGRPGRERDHVWDEMKRRVWQTAAGTGCPCGEASFLTTERGHFVGTGSVGTGMALLK